VKKSALLGSSTSLRTIHHGIDTQLFAPQDRGAVRLRLGLSPADVVIGFGASSLSNLRKGFGDMIEALHRLPAKRNLVVLAFGGGNCQEPLPSHVNLRRTGHLQDERQLAEVYSAADFLVTPSYAETFGLTNVEAMACGTPVVAYYVGPTSEYILPDETGLLAALGDTRELALRIAQMLEQRHQRERMGENARALVQREFTIEQQTRKHVELYELARKKREPVEAIQDGEREAA
jgi:glycosyltransferase involved in cell wall biosynthesis